MPRFALLGLASILAFVACGDDSANGTNPNGTNPDGTPGGNPPTGKPTDPTPTTPPKATCDAAGGSASLGAITLAKTLSNSDVEGWLASPAIADLDGDGVPEIIAVRESKVYAWHADGTKVWEFDTGQTRIWASPVVANFTGDKKLEIAVAAYKKIYLLDAAGAVLPKFPVNWDGSEVRTIAAGDIDGDQGLDIVIGSHNATDVVSAFHASGSPVTGFPPVSGGTSQCDPGPCYLAGLYDQNLAIADLDGDGKQDMVLPQDNAYVSMFGGTGAALPANAMFHNRPKAPGVRYMLDLDMAKQGFANDEDTQTQAHFTNTPPAIADIDGDGQADVIMVSSVQNAAQTDRLKGVALWAVEKDVSRVAGWEAPFTVPAYVMGLNDGFAHDFDGDPVNGASNLVGLTNQVTVAKIAKDKPGLQMIFAGYDGKIHAVGADKSELWTYGYAVDGRALTPGIVVADLTADGAPEIVFTTYSPDDGGGNLFVLDANGNELKKIALPHRGSMAVPTVGDVRGDGSLSIVVSTKDEGDGVLVYDVAGGKPNCLLWPTGRANNFRNGWVP